MNALTPDELARVRFVLRQEAADSTNAAVASDLLGLADKLTAEPEQGAVAERERDEAREALRELIEDSSALLRAHTRAIWTLSGEATYPPGERGAMGAWAQARLAAARAVLEGVERTHALVPVQALGELAAVLDGLPFAKGAGWANTLRAAARGERPEWPS